MFGSIPNGPLGSHFLVERSYILFQNTTTVTQGSIGLGLAVSWFVRNGYIVSLPLNDNQSYDLVVDNGMGLKKVQVKTTRHKDGNVYLVQLRSIRSNTKTTRVKKFDASGSDMLFIATETGDYYLIPSSCLDGRNAVSLGCKAQEWRVS